MTHAVQVLRILTLSVRKCFNSGRSLDIKLGSFATARRPCQRFISDYAGVRSDGSATGTTATRDKPRQKRPPLKSTKDSDLGFKSLHVRNIHPDTTDEQFEKAFAELEGLGHTELLCTPIKELTHGNIRTRFGFLHFRDAASAAAALQQLSVSPVIVNGYETIANPRTSREPTVFDKSHVLRITDVPKGVQYDDVVKLLDQKQARAVSIRLVTGKRGDFVGCVNVVFETPSDADEARGSLIGSTLGGVEILGKNLRFGRPLYDEKPTTSLMVLGIQRTWEGDHKIRDILENMKGLTMFHIDKDESTTPVKFKGTAILHCRDILSTWGALAHLNATCPSYRVFFIVNKRHYVKNQKRKDEELNSSIHW